MHGVINPQIAEVNLDQPKKFISFVCFLIQFKFKLLNIDDISLAEKNRQRNDLCSLLFSMLENCDNQYYYYPMRALSEFYMEEV